MITLKQLNDLNVVLRATFQKTYDAVDISLLQKISMLVPSTKGSETHVGLSSVPAVSEFLDERSVKRLFGKSFDISNRIWESTIGVKREDVERDNLGLYVARVSEMANKAKTHPLSLLVALLAAGESSLCYDGQYFHDTDHSEGSSGTQSNLLTGTGTNITQFMTDYAAAKAAMKAFKDDVGEPFFGEGTQLEGNLMVMVPLGLESVAKKLFGADLIGSDTNIFKGEAVVYGSPRLSHASDWYLNYVGGSLKPFIFQEESPVEFMSLTNPNASDSVFMRSEYLYGTYARYNVGNGLWQYSVKTSN